MFVILNIKLFFYFLRIKQVLKKVNGPNIMTRYNTERKLNVHKTLRRCPGRVLNILQMFNLHPVSIENFFKFEHNLILKNWKDTKLVQPLQTASRQ